MTEAKGFPGSTPMAGGFQKLTVTISMIQPCNWNWFVCEQGVSIYLSAVAISMNYLVVQNPTPKITKKKKNLFLEQRTHKKSYKLIWKHMLNEF